MFDLNAIVSAALNAAVQQAVAPLVERIATLESANDILHRTQHEDMVAMRDRIAALEGDISHKVQIQQANITAALAERVAALESAVDKANLAEFIEGELIAALEVTDIVGEDRVAQIESRIAALETKLTEANLFTQTSNATITIDEARMVEALNSQEWFWEKLQNRIDSTVEAGIDEHCSNYDHDDYDSHVSDDDKHFDGDIEDAVRDALSNMSFDISIR